MVNVLIPTDFSLGSLDIAAQAAQAVPDKLNIFFFHAFDMPDSLIDAMIKTGARGHNRLVTEDLRLKCRKIKAANPVINNISFRIMYGTTVALFRNFAEANAIDLIVYPENYRFVPAVRESIDPARMFLKSGIKVMRSLTTERERPVESKQATNHAIETNALVLQ
jgi:hypothetical protein